MPVTDETLDTILTLLKQLETTLLGLKQLRGIIGNGTGHQMLEMLIEEAEARITEVKHKLIQ